VSGATERAVTTLVDEYNSLPKLAPILFCGQPVGVLVGAYALEN